MDNKEFNTVPIAEFCFSIFPLGTALKECSAAMRSFVECSMNLINDQSGKYRYTKRHPLKGKYIIKIIKKLDTGFRSLAREQIK
ncbi:hypothetical protein [Parabacteroides provencensis]|uniref:hypothetical protein n=1 Tax=Parabacteroides provencensis TaxID=1944636 RepID=UPI00117CD1CF|nr:hypothetical protein [Parabacteroides provencensis]